MFRDMILYKCYRWSKEKFWACQLVNQDVLIFCLQKRRILLNVAKLNRASLSWNIGRLGGRLQWRQ